MSDQISKSDACTMPALDESPELAALIGVYSGAEGDGLTEAESSLAELKSLAEAAGARVVLQALQKRARLEAATLAGSGKLEELRDAALAQDANLIIFDNALSGSQIRNIEKLTGLKVIDRTPPDSRYLRPARPQPGGSPAG